MSADASAMGTKWLAGALLGLPLALLLPWAGGALIAIGIALAALCRARART